MNDEAVIRVEHVSKKFCKNLKTSMRYGIEDISRNAVGMPSRCGQLREREFWAVDDVSFEVERGETLGLIGPNGSGKTTLLKMLNGIFWPDKGKITVKGRVGALIEVGAGFHPMLTGRENIYVNAAILGMSKAETQAKFDSIVEFADIGDFLDTSVKHYSSGMFVRLGFAVAVHCEPDVLLVDEVLAVGDEGFQTKCFNKIGELREAGITTILVSHNMHTISNFAGKAVLLQNGRATYYDNTAQAIKTYNKLFLLNGEADHNWEIQTLHEGNNNISFNTRINKTVLTPGDDITLLIDYAATKEYRDVEIDVVLLSSSESGMYFQATNKAYDKVVNLLSGKHTLAISVERAPIHNSVGRLAVSIWAKNRAEMLFWCRVPVEFTERSYAHGNNFFRVRYETLA